MPARPFLACTPLRLHAASCAGDHACQCVHALASLIAAPLGACAQAQSLRQPGQLAGRTGRVGRSQQGRVGCEVGLPHAPARPRSGFINSFNGCPYLSLVPSTSEPAAPAGQWGTAGRSRPPPRPPATMRLSFSLLQRVHLYCSCEHCYIYGPRCRNQYLLNATDKKVLWRRF